MKSPAKKKVLKKTYKHGLFRWRDSDSYILNTYTKGKRISYFNVVDGTLRDWDFDKNQIKKPIKNNYETYWDGVGLLATDPQGFKYSYKWRIRWGIAEDWNHRERKILINRILDGVKKNPERFKFLSGRPYRIDAVQMANYLNQRRRACDVTGLTVYAYRLGGSNTYGIKDNQVVSLHNKPLSRRVTNSLRRCDCCGKQFVQEPNSKYEQIQLIAGIGYTCPNCAMKIKSCDYCGKDMLRSEGQQACGTCESHNDTRLHNWGYNPPFWKYGRYDGKGVKYTNKPDQDTELLQGLEFEFEFDDNYHTRRDVAEHLKDRMKSDFVYFTTDSSLSYGVEMHTQPATLEAVKRIQWDEVFALEETLGDIDVKLRTGRNGLHVHTNRTAYKPLHVARIAQFYKNCVNLTIAVADRVEERQFEQYARFTEYHLTRLKNLGIREAKKGEKYFKPRFGERTEALNCTKSKTLEYRWGGGCETKADLFTKLEYIDAVFKYTLTASNKALKGRDFKRWAEQQKTYPNLNNFLNSKAGLKAVRWSGIKPNHYKFH